MTFQHHSHNMEYYAEPLVFASAPALPRMLASRIESVEVPLGHNKPNSNNTASRHLNWLWLIPVFHFGIGGLLSLNVAMAQSTIPMMADKEATDKAVILRMLVQEDAHNPYMNAAHQSEAFMTLPEATIDVPVDASNDGLVASVESDTVLSEDLRRLTASLQDNKNVDYHADQPRAQTGGDLETSASVNQPNEFVVGQSNNNNELLRAFEDTDINRMEYKVVQKQLPIIDYITKKQTPEKTAKAPNAKKNSANSGFSLRNPLAHMRVSSHFGPRWGRMHDGTDLAMNHGAPIMSAEAGKVIYSGWKGGYGLLVIVDHGNGIKTKYGHCSTALVKEGQRVERGQKIALVGSTGHSTGPHLHFEVVKNDVAMNPLSHLNQA